MNITVLKDVSGVLTKLNTVAVGSEKALEDLVASSTELRTAILQRPTAVVGRQLRLDGVTGRVIPDILLADSDGRLHLVEVKLGQNPESAREIIAQALEYLSRLREYTVDSLNDLAKGGLEEALRKVGHPSETNEAFEARWSEAARKLDRSDITMVLVLDTVSERLESLTRFVALKGLPISLVSIEAHGTADGQRVWTAVPLVEETELATERARDPEAAQVDHGAIEAIVEVVRDKLPGNATLERAKTNCWKIFIESWPRGVHYEILKRRSAIGVELHNELATAAGLRSALPELAAKAGAVEGVQVFHDPEWSVGGSIGARFSLETPAGQVADAMVELMARTQEGVTARLKPT